MNPGQGFDYDALDRYKRAAQEAAVSTTVHLKRHGYCEYPGTRGESVYIVWEGAWAYGFVIEGLGTKNLVADSIYVRAELECGMTPDQVRESYAAIGIDNAAMVFNDMATWGIRPVVYGQHLALGENEWFTMEQRWQGFIAGTVKACDEVRCSWGCGETPALQGIIQAGAAELSGASWGKVEKMHLITGNIQAGDRIMLLPSSGVHANGLTKCRKIAAAHPDGYGARMSDGRTFGEGLLEPTMLYGPIVELCQRHGADIHYGINITGHGWRKLMRSNMQFVYVIKHIPKPHPVFGFIQEHGQMSVRDMYADYNMGAGFALIVPRSSVTYVESACKWLNVPVMDAGYVQERGGEKSVVISPIDVTFQEHELSVR